MNMDTKICNAFQGITPNILDGILKDCLSETKTVTEFKPRKRRNFFHKLSVKAKAIEFRPFFTVWHGILMEQKVLKNYFAARRVVIC